MSTASVTRNINFVTKAGAYSTMVTCRTGDIEITYEGDKSNPVNVQPNFAVDKPILDFVVMSSRVNETVTYDSATFKVAGIELTFGSDGLSTNTANGMAGMFKRLAPSTNGGFFGLQILKNPAPLTLYDPIPIEAVMTVRYGVVTDKVSLSHTIKVNKSTGSPYRVTIAAGDTNNYVIRAKGGQCILKAMTYLSGAEVTAGLTYQWQKLTSTGWSNISGATSQSYTVTEGSIETYADFRVIVKSGATEIGNDIQGVMDMSDPYQIDPNPSPTDETVYEGASTGVTYTPKLVKRGTTTAVTGATFTYVVKDPAGVIKSTTTGASLTVSYADIVQGFTSVTIFADLPL